MFFSLSFSNISLAETLLCVANIKLALESGNEKPNCESLKEKNIFVRYFNQPLIDNYLRISIGTDEQMEKLYAALEEITGQVK